LIEPVWCASHGNLRAALCLGKNLVTFTHDFSRDQFVFTLQKRRHARLQ
jgi:hypothetical protein